MTEGKRKRLTTVEAVEAALNLTKEFIGERIDDFKKDVHHDVKRLEDKIEAHGEIIREHDKQIASLCTIVKNGNCSTSRWNGMLGKKPFIGGGAVTLIAGIVYGILKLAGVL